MLPTATVISHSAIVEGNLATIFALIASNLNTDAPYIMQLSPTTKTATILLGAELGLATISAILASLGTVPPAAPPAA